MSRYNNSRPRTGKEIPTKPARDKNKQSKFEIMKNEKEIIEEYELAAKAMVGVAAFQITASPARIDIPSKRKMRPGAKWIHRDSDGQYEKKKSE